MIKDDKKKTHIIVTGKGGGSGSTDWDDITNKPNFATVATSGSYDDLDDKPTIPAAPVQSDWNEADNTSLAYIQNKPTIPAAQVNSDWNEANSSSKAYIQNKPSTETLTFTLQGGTTVTLDVYVAPQLP